MKQKQAGVLLSYLTQGIHVLSTLLYTPLMLRLLGKSEYGLYQLVYALVSYLGLLSFGFSHAYIRFYSRLKVENDGEGIAKLNGTFMQIFLVISGICMICGVAMYMKIEVLLGKNLSSAELAIARKLLIMMALSLAISFPNSVFDAQMMAREQFAFQRLLIALQYLLNPFLTLPLLLMGYGSVAMACVSTLLTFAKLIVNGWYCLCRLGMKFRFCAIPAQMLREISGFTVFIFINILVDQINWSVDKYLLGRIHGTAVVAVYSVGAQINTLYVQMSTAISSVFIPKVNRIIAERKNAKAELNDLFCRVGRIQFMVLALILSGFAVFGQRFIHLWAGVEYGEAYDVALLLMLPVTIPLIQNLGIEIQRAMNLHRVRSLVYLAIAIANILLSIPLIRCWNAKGAAFGTAVTLLLGNGVFMNWYYQAKMEIQIRLFWKKIGRIIPALILPVMLGCFMDHGIKSYSWLSLILSVGVYSIAYCLSMWLIALNSGERAVLRGMLTDIWRRND